jgi:hypothetical protein
MWIFLACTILEFLVIYKFGKDLFDLPWPAPIKWSWISLGALTLLFLAGWIVREKISSSSSKRKEKRR